MPDLGQSHLYPQSEAFENDRKLLIEVLSEFSDVDKKKVLNLFDNGEIVIEGRKDPFHAKDLGQKLLNVILKHFSGCGGDCQQGRLPCNCQNK